MNDELKSPGEPVSSPQFTCSDSARMCDVIETRSRTGAGVPGDPIRMVTRYWAPEGRLLAESDPRVDPSSESVRSGYYEGLVCYVCRAIENLHGPSVVLHCGTAENPTQELQEEIDALCARIRCFGKEAACGDGSRRQGVSEGN